MKLTKNKKASSIFPLLLVLSSLAALLFCWLVLETKFNNTFDQTIGDSQLKIYDVYQEGEKYLLYMEMAGEKSLYESVHSLAAKGGYSQTPGCGEVNGYVLWNTNDKMCFPEKETLEPALREEFNRVMTEYSRSYITTSGDVSFTLIFTDLAPLSVKALPERKTILSVSIIKDRPITFLPYTTEKEYFTIEQGEKIVYTLS